MIVSLQRLAAVHQFADKFGSRKHEFPITEFPLAANTIRSLPSRWAAGQPVVRVF